MNLRTSDAPRLARLLGDGDDRYRRYFTGLPADSDALGGILGDARMDRFWGMQDGSRLMALAMLRGFDAGYRVPAFGVFVGQTFAKKGLATLALEHTIAWCRANAHGEIMLSVHDDHAVARSMYERRGFRPDGQLTAKGHRIYRLTLS